MKEKYFTEKKYDGSYDVFCECGGAVMIDAMGHRKIPLGMGFAQRKNGSGFGIDYCKQKIYMGGCMKCGHEGIFKEKKISKKIYTNKVKKVDNVMIK